MVRVKKSLVPTEKGLALYSIVKGMDIADVEMTGRWESELAEIEKGRTPHELSCATSRLHPQDNHRTARLRQNLRAQGIGLCLSQVRHGHDAVLRQGGALRQPGLRPAGVPPDSGQDAHRHGNDRPAGQGKNGRPQQLQEQTGQAVQRSSRFRRGFNTKFIFPENKSTRKSINKRGGRK